MYRRIIGLAFLAVFSLAPTTGVFAEKQVKIAFVKMENRSTDPRYDYLEGILSGTLLFDLANDSGILIVDRSSLDSILREQELALSDLSNASQAVRVGKILGADYLLKGQYVFMGDEVMLTVSLIDVETAKTMAFTERGSTENMVHGVVEQIIRRLTGKTVTLRSEGHERSIISLKDEKPGTIILYCNLIDAEIFIDDKFVSYTIGKSTTPLELPDIKPGMRTVRIHLDGFGVVKTPEITFSDWQETVDIKPGGKQVLRASITLFTYQLYNMQQLANGNKRFDVKEFAPYADQIPFSFTDRDGRKHSGALKLTLSYAKDKATYRGELTLDGKTRPVTLICPAGKTVKDKQSLDKVDVSLEVGYDPERYCRIEYRLTRNDVSQDMRWKK